MMLAREAAVGIDVAKSLVVPVLIHDGDDLPELARQIQAAKFQDEAIPDMSSESPTQELLSRKIKLWVADVVKAINRAPAFDPRWETLATEEFEQQLQRPDPKQTSVPSLGTVT